MVARTKAGPRLVATKAAGAPPGAPRRNRLNLFALAYDRVEELIVTCALKPGLHLSIQDLQEMTGFGRTPLHQAVSRLHADTLIVVRPRQGLQVAPIDLARERTLLRLRRDMERFVVRLAAERAGPSHRNQLLHITRLLRDRKGPITIVEFNQVDRRIDHLLSAAAGEPFLEHTLRPLHAIFRRIGWVYHSRVRPDLGLDPTVECHLGILEAVHRGRIEEAIAASDRLLDFNASMFEAMDQGIDPALLDCNHEFLAAG